MTTLNDAEIQRMRDEATLEVKDALTRLESDYPGITEGLAAALGSTAGAAGSFFALTTLGTAGLSAAGITSGLATAGSIIGGGMVAGIGVLAAPVAALGLLGYALAKRRKSAKLAAALGVALAKIYAVQERLMQNAEHFREELAGITATIEMLQRKKLHNRG